VLAVATIIGTAVYEYKQQWDILSAALSEDLHRQRSEVLAHQCALQSGVRGGCQELL
jgi:hypothetical protein